MSFKRIPCLFFNASQLVAEGLRLLLNLCFGGGECLVCGKQTVMGQVCKKCRDRIADGIVNPPPGEERCSVCGKILLSESGKCMDCRRNNVIGSCDRVFPMLSYRLWAKNLMFQWKSMEKRGISPFIASLCNKAILFRLEMKDVVVVPVPPRPGKMRKKGWDQIDEICRFLDFRYGYKVMHLLRRNATVQQKKLGRVQRLESAEKSYALSGNLDAMDREKLPECVIIIDDVMTTGITVETCAAELKKAGIKKVVVLTVFVVD